MSLLIASTALSVCLDDTRYGCRGDFLHASKDIFLSIIRYWTFYYPRDATKYGCGQGEIFWKNAEVYYVTLANNIIGYFHVNNDVLN